MRSPPGRSAGRRRTVAGRAAARARACPGHGPRPAPVGTPFPPGANASKAPCRLGRLVRVEPGRTTGATRSRPEDPRAIPSDPNPRQTFMFTLKRTADRRNGVTTAPPGTARTRHSPELSGSTVVVIGGSAGIGLEIARRARAEGADVILTGREPGRLERAALEIGTRSADAFDAGDEAALQRFFDGLPVPIDHVVVTAGGPHDGPPVELQAAQLRGAVSERVALAVARSAAGQMGPGGTLLLVDGSGGRRMRRDVGVGAAGTAVGPRFTAALAAALAPMRVRVERIAPGVVDTPALGRAGDVAALAVHAMADTPLTGATDDIDGGRLRLAR